VGHQRPTARPPAEGQTERPASRPAPAQPAPDLHGAIRRSELLWVHRQGAQQFIQQVRVRPSFRRGRFFGWRILAYRGPGPIESGDVVRRVNGRPIERPEQFMGVWEKLPGATELVVELWRRGRPVKLRYPIVTD
jgi:hypothetical protein